MKWKLRREIKSRSAEGSTGAPALSISPAEKKAKNTLKLFFLSLPSLSPILGSRREGEGEKRVCQIVGS